MISSNVAVERFSSGKTRESSVDTILTALWSVRELENPTAEDVLLVASNLRTEGDLKARRLAEEIERACRAAVCGVHFSGR